MHAKYVHTNLIAQDWKRLSDFYSNVFGCSIVPPERDYQGEALDVGTGLKGARLRGVHLRLQGYEGNGPTLEIYSYDSMESHPGTTVNRPGFGHIAFEVEDVRTAAEAVKSHGGNNVGEIVTLTTKTGAQVT